MFFLGATHRKKFKVWNEYRDAVEIWTVRDQEHPDRQLERKGLELCLDDDPAVQVFDFDDILADDDDALRDRETCTYQARLLSYLRTP